MALSTLALCVQAQQVPDDDVPKLLKPFQTDGCSLFPDGPIWAPQRWQACCVAHDFAYWQGGDYAARLSADEALMHCVESTGEAMVSVAMLLGVRAGGSPFWPTPFRWGYGWEQWRGYAPLSEAEAAQVEAMLKQQNLLSE